MRFSRQIAIAVGASLVLASVISFVAPSAYAAWTSGATATFSQSSQLVPSVTTFVSCTTDLATNSANLTWTAAPATLNGSAFKQYDLDWIYSDGPNKGKSIVTASRTSPFATPTSTNLTGNSYVLITYEYANGWLSNTPVSYNFTRSTDGQNSPVCSPEK
jgi:hypothetical protein